MNTQQAQDAKDKNSPYYGRCLCLGENHFKKARKNYVCRDCQKRIDKGDVYYAEVSTLPLGNRGVKNITVGRFCIQCVPIPTDYFELRFELRKGGNSSQG